MRTLLRYFSLANITAGFTAVMVGFISSAFIIFQAAATVGASAAEVSSWLLALGVGVFVTCVGLSAYYRLPILTAWSTPGAALLVASLSGVTLPQATGAFIFSAVLAIIAGATGLFEKLMPYIPRSLAAAMLSGVLLHFGINLFAVMQEQSLLVFGMLFFYLIGKRFFPRFGIFLVLISGVLIAASQGLIHPVHLQLSLAHPVFIAPEFSWPILISVGLPLFVVTMTSQMIPGFAVMQNAGFKPPVSSILTVTGIATLLLAPFGGFSINLAALTGAICTGEQAGSNPAKRYRATMCAGVFYLIMGLFGATLVTALATFPKELVAAIAGLALMSTLGSNLKTAVEDDDHREPALITFLVAASGVNLLGVSAAFWGLLAGMLSSFILGTVMKPALVTGHTNSALTIE